ncbi:sirohydrochlorin chelatase [Actinomadura bangladeshensis]|uniref:Sirohydrochlorin chelatase n=1 Tax=Actinomadura bangladeshensis TaxID=453573 RepID=A0A4R4NQN5_9ACTN|nr:sirohydrochlorin chelatase [Actinomadura bangladeshensis]TDC11609.1 sirohydrochlorin chelatase [Actinomadura bangladeshensis]
MADPAGGGPALLAVAHGTRDPAGPAVIGSLLDRVRALRPGLRVAEAYGELARPSLEEAAAGLAGGPVVVVPLLLARGYHALIDIPDRAARLLPGAVTSRPLGPDPLLADVLADRLGARTRIPPRRPDAVVLAAAGSADPAGAADVRAAAQLLARRLRRPVTCGFVAEGGPALGDAVARLRRRGAGRVVVAPYLLAPGRFLDRARACGADAVAGPIGAHDAAARLVLRRYDEARSRVSEPACAR